MQKVLLYSSHAVGALTVTAVISNVVKCQIAIVTWILAFVGFGKKDGNRHRSD